MLPRVNFSDNDRFSSIFSVMSNIIYAVLQGKSVDEVYLAEKMRLEKLQLTKAARSRGYVAPVDHEARQKNLLLKQRTASNASETSTIYISENSFDSTSSFMFPAASQSSFTAAGTSSQYFSQSNEFLQELGSSGHAGENHDRFEMAPLVQSAHKTTRTNSSSKNNEAGNALRENFDMEQRQKSNQKNVSNFTFSGKDQKNVSPYLQKSGVGGRLLTGGNTMLKAKRQISFDS
jgi:hypothetical protein